VLPEDALVGLVVSPEQALAPVFPAADILVPASLAADILAPVFPAADIPVPASPLADILVPVSPVADTPAPPSAVDCPPVLH